MFRRQTKKSRFETDAAFREYLEECWPEHFRRISLSRRAAPFVKIYYPVLGFLFSSILAGGITLAVAVAARQEFLWKENASTNAQGVRNFLEHAVPIMWAATIAIVVVTVIGCIAAGIARAHKLMFDAEKLELNARLEYGLWLARSGAGDGSPFETLTPTLPSKSASPEAPNSAKPTPATRSTRSPMSVPPSEAPARAAGTVPSDLEVDIQM